MDKQFSALLQKSYISEVSSEVHRWKNAKSGTRGASRMTLHQILGQYLLQEGRGVCIIQVTVEWISYLLRANGLEWKELESQQKEDYREPLQAHNSQLKLSSLLCNLMGR